MSRAPSGPVDRPRTTPSRGIPRVVLVCVASLGVAAVGAGCADHEFEPPDREAQVEEAAAQYSAALFDSITWPADSVRAFEGNLVYSAECRQCHGPLGRGGTDYAEERDLGVPSLVEAEWEYAGDLDAARRRIFTGHPDGMPTWGVGRLEPREVDAVAFYVLESLRPEVLGSEEGRGSSGE